MGANNPSLAALLSEPCLIPLMRYVREGRRKEGREGGCADIF